MLKEYDDMKEEIKSLKTSIFIKDFNLFIKQCYRIYQTMRFGTKLFEKNQDLSMSKSLVDY